MRKNACEGCDLASWRTVLVANGTSTEFDNRCFLLLAGMAASKRFGWGWGILSCSEEKVCYSFNVPDCRGVADWTLEMRKGTLGGAGWVRSGYVNYLT